MSNIIKSAQVKKSSEVKLSNERGYSKKSDKKGLMDNKNKTTKAKKIIAEAKVKAKELLDEAEQEAEMIKNKARQEAKQKSQEILEEAREEGYSEGFSAGQVEGKESGQQEVSQNLNGLLSSIEQQINDFYQKLERRWPQLKEDVVKLSIGITRKIIKKELKTDNKLIHNVIENALEVLDREEEIKIRVNPDDLKKLGDYKEKLITANNGLEEVKIVPDKSINLGGCIIETDFGGVDATFSSQLAQIEEKLLEVNDND